MQGLAEKCRLPYCLRKQVDSRSFYTRIFRKHIVSDLSITYPGHGPIFLLVVNSALSGIGQGPSATSLIGTGRHLRTSYQDAPRNPRFPEFVRVLAPQFGWLCPSINIVKVLYALAFLVCRRVPEEGWLT